MRHVLCFFSCLLTCFSAQTKPLIIFDAGSTGTRIHVYDVEADQAQSLHTYRVKPGLSSMDPDNTQSFDQYFYLLLLSTEGILKPEDRGQTPIYLYATAGMRMLPADEQNAIMSVTRESLNKQAKVLGFSDATDVRTISGSEEATFIWISDNYLNGNLKQDTLSAKNTVVAVEMGGTSSEIAYIAQSAQQYTVPFAHKGFTYPVYSYAYDGLGADKAIASLYASGTPNFAACFPVGAPYPLATGEFIGTGNLDACVHAIKHEFIDPSAVIACHQATPFECSDFGVYQPLEIFTNHYILTSAFYYLFNTLGIADQTVPYSHFVEKAQDFCSMTWEEVQKIDQSADYLISYCFNAALSKTLFDAWHVNKKDKLTAVSSLNDITLEWPLGAALQLAP